MSLVAKNTFDQGFTELSDILSDPDVIHAFKLTVVVAGSAPETVAATPAELNGRVQVLIGEGVDKKSAIAQIAREVGVPKRQVYDAVLAQSANT